MISRYHKEVPSKKETKAFEKELRDLKPLTSSPVKMTELSDTATFGDPIDLGIFPQPSILTDKDSKEA